MGQHKGFDASPRKLRQARKRGQVLKSPLLTQSAAFLVILLCIIKDLETLWLNNRQMLEWCLSLASERLGICSIRIGSQTLWVILSALFYGAIVVVLIEILQVKFEFFWEPLCPQLDRLNPVNGIKRIHQGLCRSWLLLLKLIFVIMLAQHFVVKFANSAQAAFLLTADNRASALLPEIICFSYISSACLLFFGVIEDLANRKRFMQEHSMSHDEVRREYKEDEGDPHIKAKCKALHEAMIMQELVKRVRSSKVIIVD